MVGIKRDIGLVFCGNFYRERLVVLVLQINLLSDLYFLCSRKLCDRNGENCVRIRHSVSLLRHQMDVDFFADFHLCNGCIEAADHLAHTADELERFAAVVGRIKLGSIVEGSSVVGTAGFSDILTFHNRSRCTASAAAGSAGTAAGALLFLMASAVVAAGMAFLMIVVIAGCTCRCERSV